MRIKYFLYGVMALAGVAVLNAEIILKDNLKNNYPEVAANVVAASKLAYSNDEAGYYRYLADSKADNMYIDIDVDGGVIGGGAAALSGDTMYVKEDFLAREAALTYHEAWHRVQALRLPDIDKMLPPYYAVFMNMVREAGANWYQQIMEEKTGAFPKPATPAGMTDAEFDNKRFNEFFVDFFRDSNYLNLSIDGLASNYGIRKVGKYSYAPSILNPDYLTYLDHINELMQVYLEKYSPNGAKFDRGVMDYMGMFEPILKQFDAERQASGKITFAQLTEDLKNSVQTYPTLAQKKYNFGLSAEDREKLITSISISNANPKDIMKVKERYLSIFFIQ